MARIVRFSDIASERQRERGFKRGREQQSLWQRLRRASWEILAVSVIFVSAAYIAAMMVPSEMFNAFVEQPRRELDLLRAADVREAHFDLCSGSKRITCVVDGDTIWLDGVKIRLADIDTPEVSNPSCSGELALGQQATARLAALLNQGPFAVEPYEPDEDVYGRKLRILSRDGQSLGAVLVEEGLARAWDGARHGWCG